MTQVIIQHSCATQERRSVSHTSTHRVRCRLQLTLSLSQTYIMENTIRVQDHPLVALQNRNIQAQDEYHYFEEMSYDIDKDIYSDGLLSPMDLLMSELFDEDEDDLPF